MLTKCCKHILKRQAQIHEISHGIGNMHVGLKALNRIFVSSRLINSSYMEQADEVRRNNDKIIGLYTLIISLAYDHFLLQIFKMSQPSVDLDFAATEVDVTGKSPVIDHLGRSYGTGKRKTSIARVWIKEGSGQLVVNDKKFIDYFQPMQREHAIGSFIASNTAGQFDVWCTVKGGGISGNVEKN
jgi:hypothetical protein